MSWSLWNGVGAMMGMLPVKTLKHVETDNEMLLEGLEKHGGPSPFICTSENSPAFQRGIKRITNSWAGHAGLHVGQARGKQIRIKHPDLLKPRKLPEDEWQGKILMPVPYSTNENEVIESQTLINTNILANIVRQGEQAVVFVREWTDPEIDAILYAAYYLYGAPYDIFEIGNWVLPFIPNSHVLRVCSDFVECALEGEDPTVKVALRKGDKDIRQWLIVNKIDPDKVSPADLGRYLFTNKLYRPIAFNCDAVEALEKV
jgi:hypothetical protein